MTIIVAKYGDVYKENVKVFLEKEALNSITHIIQSNKSNKIESIKSVIEGYEEVKKSLN